MRLIVRALFEVSFYQKFKNFVLQFLLSVSEGELEVICVLDLIEDAV
jgi:hypothetical protein